MEVAYLSPLVVVVGGLATAWGIFGKRPNVFIVCGAFIWTVCGVYLLMII